MWDKEWNIYNIIKYRNNTWYMQMVTKPKDTQHKKYINIKVYMYQTDSTPKLVTSKTFFPLTWSSPPKSITPSEERNSILKIFPLFDTIVKGHKKLKDLTWDR